MKLKCIIIDDEPLARKGLKEYVEDTEFLELIGEFDNPLKASTLISEEEIALLFLDIQMPKLTGIEFLKTLQHPPLVIFTTAYPEYAVEGFDLNAVDYLLKPFSYQRFLKAVMKARSIITGSIRGDQGAPVSKEDHFFIKTDNRIIRIKFDDILFVEALQNYIAIHTADKKHITYLTFKAVEESLPEESFIKVHKSYLVSMNKINSISGNEILVGAHHIPISRNLKDEVMDRLLKGKFLKR